MERRAGNKPMLVGLSGFLIEHEPHGAGFDVAHPTGVGSGRVAIVCRGCRAVHEYSTAIGNRPFGDQADPSAASRSQAAPPELTPPPSAETPSEKAIAPFPRSVQAGPAIPPRRPELRTSRRRQAATAKSAPAPAAGSKTDGRKRRLAPVIALVALAVAALAVAAIRLAGDDADGGAEAVGGAGAGSESTTNTPPRAPDQKIETGAYTAVIPPDWTKTLSTDGLLVKPRTSGAVQLEVFAGPDPGDPLAELASASATALRERAGSAPGPPEPFEIDGVRAFRLTSKGDGATYEAIGVISRGERYLLISRSDSKAPAVLEQQLESIIRGIQLD